MSLIGKKILVLGGNGYLGNYFASRFVQQGAIVSCLSRTPSKHNHPQNISIQWLQGSIFQAQKFTKEINSADVIVHTIGTLFDSSVFKKTPPGGPGTYEQVNRDTLVALLKILQSPKKIIYISSSAHPPFLGRYLTTKHEAEQLLMVSQHEGYSLRPGFIYSWKYRGWSIPIKWSIDLWRKVYPLLQRLLPRNSKAQELLSEFRQGQNIALEELGTAVLQLSVNGGEVKTNEVPHILNLSLKYKRQYDNKQK